MTAHYGYSRDDLFYKWTWAELHVLYEQMLLTRYVESLPVLMADYHAHYRGTGFGKPRKISFVDYHATLIPESIKHPSALSSYSPDEVRSFTIAMKHGLVSNAALAAIDTQRMRSSGWGRP